MACKKVGLKPVKSPAPTPNWTASRQTFHLFLSLSRATFFAILLRVFQDSQKPANVHPHPDMRKNANFMPFFT